MKETTFDDLFAAELATLAAAEALWAKVLPRLAKAVSTAELRSTLREQLEAAKQHQAQLKQLAREFGWKGTLPPCPAMDLLLGKCSEAIQQLAPGNLQDCALLLHLQRAEHYKLATYASAVEFARLFEREPVTTFLHAASTEVSLASKRLAQIAVQVNAEAYVDHRAPGS